MSKLVEFTMEDGQTILVEVKDNITSGSTVRGLGPFRPGEMLEKAQISYEQAIDRVRPAAQGIIAKLRDLPDPPDELRVEFGIKLNAEAGAFLAAASAEAQFLLSMTWKRAEPKKAPGKP